MDSCLCMQSKFDAITKYWKKKIEKIEKKSENFENMLKICWKTALYRGLAVFSADYKLH